MTGRGAAGVVFVLTVAFGVAPAPVQAQSESDIARARKLFQQGQAAYEAGNFEQAGQKMERAFRLAPSPELAYNVGRVYERMSKYDKAIHYLGVYLERGEPKEAERKDITERIEELRSAKRRQREQVFTAPPSNDELTAEARTFFKRGVAMFKRKRYRAAMQAFTAAHRFAKLPEVLYNMAITSEKMGRTRDAIDYYREYLRLRDDPPDRARVKRRIEKLRKQR
jgi:tetratricopeptide (TPR) repeat protein